MSKKLTFYLLKICFFSLAIYSQDIKASEVFVYNPNGKESKEFMRVLPLIQSKDEIAFNKGMAEMDSLSLKGDTSAFGMMYQLLGIAKRETEYVEAVHNYLLKVENYTALANFGKILIDAKNPYCALKYMKEAIDNKNKISTSIEDLDYNYITALLYSTDLSTALSESWKLLQPYLISSDTYFKSLFMMFFNKLQKHDALKKDQGILIRQIGHCLFDRSEQYPTAKECYIEIFSGTPHFEQLLKERNKKV